VAAVTTRSLDGKVAIVTGASRGIGREIALTFARAGARVVAAARNASDLAETARLGEGRIEPTVCDVRRSQDVRRMVETAVDRFGALHVLCNNAGVVGSPSLVVDTAEESWDDVMDVNLKGTFLCCKHAVGALAASGGGSIINLGSVNSFAASKMAGAYNASKAAVLLLTKTVAVECAEKGIRVNALCPGGVDTPMEMDFFAAAGVSREEATTIMRRLQPLVGFLSPAQIADAAVFLASDASRAITGTSLVVDGGLLAGAPEP
jgi:NAD(P)-dependent dehydrogenase (short-subunit alcohol dehydrogenase family)